MIFMAKVSLVPVYLLRKKFRVVSVTKKTQGYGLISGVNSRYLFFACPRKTRVYVGTRIRVHGDQNRYTEAAFLKKLINFYFLKFFNLTNILLIFLLLTEVIDSS